MKVLARVLDAAIRQMVDIKKFQFCFVPSRETTDAIFYCSSVAGKYRALKNLLYFCLVELQTAFDRVPRAVFWWAFRELGAKEWAVCTKQGMYFNARSWVCVNGQLSKEFEDMSGVRHRSIFSPFLFILF